MVGLGEIEPAISAGNIGLDDTRLNALKRDDVNHGRVADNKAP